MGLRLLRNFTRDPGNRMTLGIFVGTFAYTLVLRRTICSVEEVACVPHLGINVGTVIGAVPAELPLCLSRPMHSVWAIMCRPGMSASCEITWAKCTLFVTDGDE